MNNYRMRVLSENSLAGQELNPKFFAQSTAESILGIACSTASTPLIKTASVPQLSKALRAIAELMESLGVQGEVTESKVGELIEKHAAAPKDSESKQTSIKIASKSIKDSHYEFDVSKDVITHEGRSLVMVCFFMKEAYLGKYMIKRNFYYLPSNDKEADNTYQELVRKSGRVKQRYHEGAIKTFDILPEVKSFLDGIRGDFESSEDSIGTTVKRDKESYHETQGPPYVRMAGYRQPGAP